MVKRKYPINEQMFDKINNKSAYWLGFLYADGNCTTENRIRLQLSLKDKDVLNKFRNFMQSNTRPIKLKDNNGYPACHFGFRSWRVHNRVKVYELTQRKEKRHRLHPDLLQKGIRQHFIRGYFDGDGSFYVDKRGYLFAEITGYKPVIRDIKNCLVSDGIISEKKKIVKNGPTVVRLRLSASEAVLLGKYLYKDAFYFADRKHTIYKNHVERLNNLTENRLSLMRQSKYKVKRLPTSDKF